MYSVDDYMSECMCKTPIFLIDSLLYKDVAVLLAWQVIKPVQVIGTSNTALRILLIRPFRRAPRLSQDHTLHL